MNNLSSDTKRLTNSATPDVIDYILISLLAALSFWIRYFFQQLRPLDIDDLFQLFAASRPSITECIRSLRLLGAYTPFLDYIIDFSFLKVIGNIDALRLTPIFWGVSAIIMTYFLGRLLHDGLFGWMWAVLLAFSTFHIDYSQRLRQYSLIVYLSVLCLFFFFKFMEDRRWFWCYVITMTLFHMVYIFAVCTAALQLLYVWIIHRSKLKLTILSTLISTTALVLSLLATRADTMLNEQVLFYSAGDAFGKHIIIDFLQSLNFGASLLNAVFLLLALIGFDKILQSKSDVGKPVLFVSIMFGTLSATFFLFIKFHYFFNSRHGISILPLYLYFVTSGFYWLWGKFRNPGTFFHRILFFITIPGLIVGLSSPHLRSKIFGQELELRLVESGVNFLRRNVKTGDRIIFSNPNTGATVLYYLNREAFLNLGYPKEVRGFSVFVFPPDYAMTVNSKRIQSYTVARLYPEVSTMDSDKIRQYARECKRSGNQIWLVYFRINYHEGNPFYEALRLSHNHLEEKERGLYRLQLNAL